MTRNSSGAQILIPTDSRIIPVVVIDDPTNARELAQALLDGGIPTAEITLRTPRALDAITAAASVEGFTVGAGTVLAATDVDECVDAGAAYVVSPGFSDEVIDRARERSVAVLPGVATATEVQRAMAAGVRQLKLFPAGLLGGTELISALAGPFPEAKFLPSGGITAANAADYLTLPQVFAVSGSWMAPRQLIASRDFNSIRSLSLAAAGNHDE